MAQEHEHLDGVHYPTHYLVAVFDDRQDADAAAQALQQAGFAQHDVDVYQGHEGLGQIQGNQQQQGGLARTFSSLAESLTDEGGVKRSYEQALSEGRSTVGVYVPDRQQMEQARDVLLQHRGYMMSYFDPGATESLPDDASDRG